MLMAAVSDGFDSFFLNYLCPIRTKNLSTFKWLIVKRDFCGLFYSNSLPLTFGDSAGSGEVRQSISLPKATSIEI